MKISDLAGKTRIAVVALMAATLLLGACSSDSDDSSEAIGYSDDEYVTTEIGRASCRERV